LFGAPGPEHYGADFTWAAHRASGSTGAVEGAADEVVIARSPSFFVLQRAALCLAGRINAQWK
jgi:hypothetical protein